VISSRDYDDSQLRPNGKKHHNRSFSEIVSHRQQSIPLEFDRRQSENLERNSGVDRSQE
jgi:hypothetical protein